MIIHKRSTHRRIVSFMLIVIILITQVLLMNINTFAAVPEELVCTISPEAIDVTSTPVRVSVIVDEATFEPDQVSPYLLTSSWANSGAKFTNVASSSTQVDFTVGTGLTAGTYYVRLVDAGTGKTYNCGTIKVGVASISQVSPSSVANGYSENVSIAVTGTNTNFISGSTTIEVLDSSNNNTQKSTGVSVSNSESLTFTLKTGLAEGNYKIKATTTINSSNTETVILSDGIRVRGAASIELDNSRLNEGYSNTAILVTGNDSGFNEATTVDIIEDLNSDGIIDTGEESTEKASTPSIINEESLSFTASSGLEVGNYIVKVKTGEEIATTTLVVGAATGQVNKGSGEFTGVSQGYTSSQNLIFKGTNTSFTSSTDIALFNSENVDISDDYISLVSYTDESTIGFTLATGLVAGAYTVKAITGSNVVQDTISILPISISGITYGSSIVESGTDKIPLGYEAITLTVSGTNTLFVNDSDISILNSIGTDLTEFDSTIVSGQVVTNATELSFTLAEGLTAGSYKVRIDMDGSTSTTTDIVEKSFSVTTPTISSVLPASVVQGSNPVSIVVIGTNTKFVNSIPTIDFTSVTGETVNFSQVTELDDELDTERIEFSFIPDASLFEAGTYSFKISLSNDYITTSATGSIVVDDVGISISSATVYSNQLGTKEMTITGMNTSFDETYTKIYLDSELTTPLTATVTVPDTGNQTIRFTIPAGLSAGLHTITIVEDIENIASEEYTCDVLVVNRTLTISPTSAKKGYLNYEITADVTGITLNTTDNKPTIDILDGTGTKIETITFDNSYIKSATRIKFPFPVGYVSGTYQVKLSWEQGDYKDLILVKPCYIAPGAPGTAAGSDSGTYNVNKDVTLVVDANAATTYYIKGTDVAVADPTSLTGTLYDPATPIAITGNNGQTVILKAVSYDSNGNIGVVMTKTYIFDKAGPTAPNPDIATGIYNTSRSVTISTATDAVHTYYTLDGSAPTNTVTTSNLEYTGIPISIDGANGVVKTLKVISYDVYGNPSSITTRTYTFDKAGPSIPTVSLGSNTYEPGTVTVTVNTATDAVNTYYTLSLDEGVEPTNSDESCTNGSTIDITGTDGTTYILMIKSFDSLGNPSQVLSQEYVFNAGVVEAPGANYPSGRYNIDLNVVLDIDEENAVATYYTLVNDTISNTPSETNIYYEAGDEISITAVNNEVVTLIAASYNSGGDRSDLMTKTYTFDLEGPEKPSVDIAGCEFNTTKNIKILPKTGAVATYYTLDGTDPISSGTRVSYVLNTTIPISVGAKTHGETQVLKAVSYDSLTNPGQVMTETYTVDLEGPALPTVDIPGNTYNEAKNVTINPAPDAVVTYYVLDNDGTTPLTEDNWTEYEGEIINIVAEAGQNKVLRAISYDDLSNQGEPMTQTYFFIDSEPIPAPEADVDNGTYNYSLTVTIGDDDLALNTYYTLGTEGEEPTDQSAIYEGPIDVTAVNGTTVYLKAVSYGENGRGNMLVREYTFDTEGPLAPDVDIKGDTYTTAIDVTIIPALSDVAETYYTLDGTEPTNVATETNLLYNGSTINIQPQEDGVITLRAISFDSVGNKGAELTEVYYLNANPPASPTTEAISGLYNEGLNVILTVDESAVNTYYTIDGSTPSMDSETSILYEDSIAINAVDVATVVLKAVSYDKDLLVSEELTRTFTFDTQAPDMPISDVPTGTYTSARNVTLTLDLPDAVETYYQLALQSEITDPSKNSGTEYTGGTIAVNGQNGQVWVLKAISYDQAGNASEIMTTTLTFTVESGGGTTPTGGGTTPTGGGTTPTGGTTTPTDDKVDDDTDDVTDGQTDKPSDDQTGKTEEPDGTTKVSLDLEDKIETIIDSENDKTTIEIDEELITETIDQIVQDEEVNFILIIPDSTTSTREVKLTKEAINRIKEKVDTLTIESDETTVKIPVELLKEFENQDMELNLKKLDENEIEELNSSVGQETGKKIASQVIDFTISAINDGTKNIVSTFEKPVTISIKMDGMENTTINVKKLGIYYLDEETGNWIYVGGRYNPDTGNFETSVNHFTKFTVMEYNKVFSDIKSDYWGKEFIEILASKHIIAGMTEETFVPTGVLTRAQFAVLIAKALNLTTSDYTGRFTDVTDAGKDAWFMGYVEATAKAGIINGVGDGSKFDPGAKITREQMAKMIVEAYIYKTGKTLEELSDNTDVLFNDHQKISNWSTNYIKAAYGLNIISGIPDSNGIKFDPLGSSQRVHAATVIYKLLDELGEL